MKPQAPQIEARGALFLGKDFHTEKFNFLGHA